MHPAKEMRKKNPPEPTKWETIFISGGRKHKISKGDIAGLFIKQGKIHPDRKGLIEAQAGVCVCSGAQRGRVNDFYPAQQSSYKKEEKYECM